MPKIAYKEMSIRKSGLDLISQINAIIDDYQRQGYSLTLRQVYYQLVSRDVIQNNEKSYNNLGVLVGNGRMSGMIDWNAIEDRTRYLRQLSHWNNPQEIMLSAAHSYNIDLWEEQDYYIEVWVEKDALIGVVEQAANRYDTPCFSCRGFVSLTEMWTAAQRLIAKNEAGCECVILHLGDHDPSGIDMTRDVQERLIMFGADVRIERIALNMPQIEQYDPPPNPAKLTDTRSGGYIAKYGTNSWELDALEPRLLDGLITDHIQRYLDIDLFNEAKVRQEQERKILRNIVI